MKYQALLYNSGLVKDDDDSISTNGLISLGTSFTNYRPNLFPIATPVIAPYWDDSDLSYGRGEVRYAVITPATNLSLCNQVNDYLSTSTGSSVSVEWILWAYWKDISTNGLISLGTSFTNYRPNLFPIATPVIAPYWDDNDLRVGGEVHYAVMTPATNLSLCNQVNNYLSTSTGRSVSVEWILWAYWKDACPFLINCNNTKPNSFQVVLAFQSTATYAVFIYKCGLIRWTTCKASVGINSGDGYYINHPLSHTDNVTDIDCYNEISGWSNVLYRQDQDMNVSNKSHDVLIIGICFGFSVFLNLVLLLAVVIALRNKCRKKSQSSSSNDPKEDVHIKTEVNAAYEVMQRRSNQTETSNEIQISQNSTYADATNVDETIYDDIPQEIPPEPDTPHLYDDESAAQYKIPSSNVIRTLV
uniref:NIDO domain-containing protein n=1 Tax=Amphimedon queenslandica TaxID=400682 RepID=A0A1X7VJ09_AMPQE